MDSAHIRNWNKSLGEEKLVLQTLYKIFAHFKASHTTSTSDLELLLTTVRQVLSADHDPITTHLAHQVFYQILFLLDRLEPPSSPSAIYGMLYANTDYHLRFSPTELKDRCLTELENTSRLTTSNCQTLVFSLLSVIKIIDLYGYDQAMSTQLWPIIELHLETPIARVRELLLQVFAHVASDVNFSDHLILSISQNYSWLNRNRYELLAALASSISVAKYPECFFNGLSQSIKFRRLMRASQKLVKELRKQQATNQRLINIVIDVLKTGTDLEIQNLAMFWSTSIDLDTIYDSLDLASMTTDELTQSPDYEYLRKQDFQTLVILRHMLAPTALLSHPQILEIDEIVVRCGIEHQNYYIRQLICDILVKRSENLDDFHRFLTINVNAEDSALRNFTVIKVKQLLHLLYKKRRTEDAQKLSRIFREGDYDRYQETITRLLIFEVYLDVTKGVSGLFTFLDSTAEDVKEFLEWLEALIPTMLASRFDDIRDTTLRLILRYFMQEVEVVTSERVKSSSLELAKSKDLKLVGCCHQYANIFRHLNVDVHSFWEELADSLQNNLQEFSKDPFWATQQGHNLFGLVNSLNELVPAMVDQSAMEKQSLLCEEIARNLLNFLNSRDDEVEMQRPTFEKMEQSLTRLLQDTRGVVTNQWQDEQTLLKSIWMTLKACCEYSASLAKREIFVANQIKLHRTVLLGCCHKGAIEAAGVSLGNIIHHSTSDGLRTDLFDLIKSDLIDEIVRTKSDDCLELRSTRGLCIMLHQLVKNDLTNRRELFYYCLSKLLPIAGTSAQSISLLAGSDLEKFYTTCQPLQLTLLTALVKDGCLAERMLPLMGLVLQLTFEMFKSPSWTMRNSAAQLLAAACSKLAQQKLCFEGAGDEEVTPIAIAYCDIFTKFPNLWAYIDRNVGQNLRLDMMLLKFLSLFEYRDIGRGDNAKYRSLYVKFTARRYHNSQITKQMKRFEANLEVSVDLPSKVSQFVDALLAKGGSYNEKLSLLNGIVFCLQRLEANHRHLDKNQLFAPFIDLLAQRSLDDFTASPYWLQLKLLETLLYLGLSEKDSIISEFLSADRSRFSHPVAIGHDVWLRKVSELS